MKKFITITLFGFLIFTHFNCGDKEYWRYFIRGSILSSIKDSRTELSLDNSPRSAYCFDKDLDGDQDIFVVTDGDLLFDYENLAGGRLSTPPPGYIIEEVPQRVAIADFNNDRYLDLVISNQISNDIAILLNSTSGQYNNMVYKSSGDEPFAIMAEDLNKNGYQDIVVAHLADNSIRIFSNLKNGEFDLKVVKPVGEMPFGVISSDIDKNGYPDIITVNYQSNDLSIIRNVGDFYFHDEEIYPINGSPSDIKSLDFNNDKYYDLAVTQFESDSMAIFLNNGQGEFEEMLQFPTGISPLSLITMDMDFNGWEDVIVANSDEDSLSFFMNGPEYLDQFKYSLTPGFKATHLNIGLLNSNQFYDLVLCDYANKKLLILFDIIAPQSM
jgi:hypothetical protein